MYRKLLRIQEISKEIENLNKLDLCLFKGDIKISCGGNNTSVSFFKDDDMLEDISTGLNHLKNERLIMLEEELKTLIK